MRGPLGTIAAGAVIALIAGAASSAGQAANVMTIPRGGAFVYRNLGCEYPAATPRFPDPVVYCGLWNYRGLVRHSYAFAATDGWAYLLEITPSGATVIQTFAQPEGGPAPALDLSSLPSILRQPGLVHAAYGDQFRFDGLDLLANNLKTAAGNEPLSGLLDLDQGGAVRDSSHVLSWSRGDAEVSWFVKGSGTSVEKTERQPAATPHLDSALRGIGLAEKLEQKAVDDLHNNRVHEAVSQVDAAAAHLGEAIAQIHAAVKAGEMEAPNAIDSAIGIARFDDRDVPRANSIDDALLHLDLAGKFKKTARREILEAKQAAATLSTPKRG